MKRFRSTGLQSTRRIKEGEICCERCPKEYTLHYMNSAEPAQVLREMMTQLELNFWKMTFMARDEEEERRKVSMEFEVPVIHLQGNAQQRLDTSKKGQRDHLFKYG